MNYFECTICGGEVRIIDRNRNIGRCTCCDSLVPIPKEENQERIGLLNRANHLRMKSEFDQARAAYENIVAQSGEDAESHWGICLCKYGIEYVEDKGERKPTCHRTHFVSILEDEDYLLAVKYADEEAAGLYRREAAKIDEIQKGILEVSAKEEPYSVFICFKDKDENGQRTRDSVLAQDIYEELVKRGERVFFSRISLEDKLGSQYEPYIFAALQSAKVMLAVGIRPEHFQAVWVKNEWSRYLDLMQKGAEKHLIVVYQDMEPRDFPKEFARLRLQAQDMGKIGAMQDLIYGVRKLTGGIQRGPVSGGSLDQGLVKRGMLFLKDGDYQEANGCFERALDQNPENSQAYIGKLLCEKKLSGLEELIKRNEDISEDANFKKALSFADEDYKKQLTAVSLCIKENLRKQREAQEKQRQEAIRERTLRLMKKVSKFRDADKKFYEECVKEAESQKKRREQGKLDRNEYLSAITPELNESIDRYRKYCGEQEEKMQEIWAKIVREKAKKGVKRKNLNVLYDSLKSQAAAYLAEIQRSQKEFDKWQEKLGEFEKIINDAAKKEREALDKVKGLDVSQDYDNILLYLIYGLCQIGNWTDLKEVQRRSKYEPIVKRDLKLLKRDLLYLKRAGVISESSKGQIQVKV